MGFPGGWDGKKICLQCRRPGFNPWVVKILWRRERQPTPVFLPGESHGQRSLVGYSPWCHKESDMTVWLTLTKVLTQYLAHNKCPLNVSRREVDGQSQRYAWNKTEFSLQALSALLLPLFAWEKGTWDRRDGPLESSPLSHLCLKSGCFAPGSKHGIWEGLEQKQQGMVLGGKNHSSSPLLSRTASTLVMLPCRILGVSVLRGSRDPSTCSSRLTHASLVPHMAFPSLLA